MIIQMAESEALSHVPTNHAKVLYLLGLRPNANVNTGLSQPLQYKYLKQILENKEREFKTGRQINALLKELIECGLVQLRKEQDLSHSLNTQTVLLPLLINIESSYHALHQTRQPMQPDWLPHDALFDELANLMGLLDKSYTKEDVGDFVAYWLGRPEQHLSLFQWTQKFVTQRKARAQRLGQSPIKQVGSQHVNAAGDVVVDDKTKAFINKYK